MTFATASTVSSAKRKPRLLWANVYCLMDTTSGASMAVREMLRQLVAKGYEVAVVGATIFDHPRGIERIKDRWDGIRQGKGAVVTVDDKPLLHRLILTKSTKRDEMTSKEEGIWLGLYQATLDKFKPDVVFYYGGQALDLLIPIEAKALGIPTVAYLANGNYRGSRWHRDVDLVLTDSQATADMYHHAEGFKSVPLGSFIDPKSIVSSQHTRKRLLFINPSLEKGVGIVIQLAMLLEKRRPDIIIEVVESRGNWHSMLEMVSRVLGSPRTSLKNVVVTPNTTDMRPLYGRARLLLAPSLWWESSGRVLAEAMLNGIPAIVTDRGGMAEMIGNAGIKLSLPAECYEKPYAKLPGMKFFEPLIDLIIRLYDEDLFYMKYAERAKHVGRTVHGLDMNTGRLLTALRPLVRQRAGDQIRRTSNNEVNA